MAPVFTCSAVAEEEEKEDAEGADGESWDEWIAAGKVEAGIELPNGEIWVKVKAADVEAVPASEEEVEEEEWKGKEWKGKEKSTVKGGFKGKKGEVKNVGVRKDMDNGKTKNVGNGKGKHMDNGKNVGKGNGKTVGKGNGKNVGVTSGLENAGPAYDALTSMSPVFAQVAKGALLDAAAMRVQSCKLQFSWGGSRVVVDCISSCVCATREAMVYVGLIDGAAALTRMVPAPQQLLAGSALSRTVQKCASASLHCVDRVFVVSEGESRTRLAQRHRE